MVPVLIKKWKTVKGRYYCSKCGNKLSSESSLILLENEKEWSFCPYCGEPIEWDEVREEGCCDMCGDSPIPTLDGKIIPWPEGGTTCLSCMELHCISTDCTVCTKGTPLDCKYKWIKNYVQYLRPDPRKRGKQ